MNEFSPFGALAGLKVIDLTRVLGGPYCTQILADHGADVIKIEPPQGDEVRDWGPPFHDDMASYFIGVNRNKQAMALDLATQEGRDVLLRLLDDADVLIENYKTGSMERWGIGYEEVLSKRFPKLIHARISGFGADGPYGGNPGYDAIVQAMAGWFSVNGKADSGPTRVGLAMVDMGTGLYTAIAILMATLERTRSGEGQFIDMTLYDCAVSLMHPHVPNWYLSGNVPGLTGNSHTNIAPYDKFQTQTTDIFLGVGNNRAFLRLCTELGKPELADDERFRNNSDRAVNRVALTDELEKLMGHTDGHALCDRLLKAGVPAGPVMDTEQVMTHPHTVHRDMAWSKDWYNGTGTPIKFSRTPGGLRNVPPQFAADTDDILAQRGFSDEEVAELKDKGVIATERRK
jgi:crotonobetainyl-CoA:carnitine CoA-transferase CaiB-like acyl-CoA transferase